MPPALIGKMPGPAGNVFQMVLTNTPALVCFVVCRNCGPLPFPLNPSLSLRRQPAELAGVIATSSCHNCGSLGLELREFTDKDGDLIESDLGRREPEYGRTQELLRALADAEDEAEVLEEIDKASCGLRERMGIAYDFVPRVETPGIEKELIDEGMLETAEPEPGVYLPVIRVEGWTIKTEPDLRTDIYMMKDQGDTMVAFKVSLDMRIYWFFTSMTRDLAWLKKVVVARKVGLAFMNGIHVMRLEDSSARELNLVVLGWQMGARG